MNKIITIATILIILLFFTGCKKDIRDKYVGDWDYRIIKKVESNRDTIYYTGNIMLGDADNQIIIRYSENDEITLYIEHEVYLFPLGSPCSLNYSIGQFEGNDKIHLHLHWFEQNCNINYFISGTKKEKR